MNLFPAGFNNLNPQFLPLAVRAANNIILRLVPDAKRILVIPESHTRNLLYWENVNTLQIILEQAGFSTRLATLATEVSKPIGITLLSGGNLIVEPLLRKNNKLYLTDFSPDLVLLNNDLSEGIPPILQDLDLPLMPPAELGWSQRLKSAYFQYYATVANEFSAQVNIDPWLIAPLFRYCGKIDFMEQEGLKCLIDNAEALFADIRKKYEAYQIPHHPFLVVKADAGTYGMAVMTVRRMEELTSMNRKQRTRMSMTKGKQPVRRVIIQEGVYTFETLGPKRAVAEPVVYLWGECVVGGFYRVHTEKGFDENLNAPGMHFEPIAFPVSCHSPDDELDPDACQNRLFTYGIVAQLSMLAAAREMKDHVKK